MSKFKSFLKEKTSKIAVSMALTILVKEHIIKTKAYMIKGMILGAIFMYIYLVQPAWADQIIEVSKNMWSQIQTLITS